MFILYDIIFLLYAILYIPVLLLKQKWHKGFWMRFGVFSPDIRKSIDGYKNIWIHAVSVGEVAVVLRLVDSVKEKFPFHRIVMSTVTKTGFTLAEKHSKNSFTVIYAPLDFSFIVRKFISVIRPEIYITAETELWPNLLTLLKENKTPIAVVNGRISDFSFKGYRAVKFLFKKVLKAIDVFCMQSKLDADRIHMMGAHHDNIHVVGNMKFDDAFVVDTASLDKFNLKKGDDIFVAGSTHPGEEEIILSVYKSMKDQHSSLKLVIAPRHPERANQIISMISKSGLKSLKFSEITENYDEESVIVVDTIGNLRDFYSIAKLVFVGKSLTIGGGHNVIEPAFFEKPVLVGPLTGNFRDVVEIFLNEKAIIQVKDKEELAVCFKSLLGHPEKMDKLGKLARGTIEKHKGATRQTMKVISSILK